MEVFKIVISKCIEMLNTTLFFDPFRFTIMQAMLALAVMSILIGFICKLLDL